MISMKEGRTAVSDHPEGSEAVPEEAAPEEAAPEEAVPEEAAPRDDGLGGAYSSRLRLVLGGVPLSRDDPRVPEGLRDVIDDGTEFPGREPGLRGESATWLDGRQTAILFDCLTPLLDDLAHSGAVLPTVETKSDRLNRQEIGAFLRNDDQSGREIFVELSLPYPERLAALAEQVQEWEIEALWAAARPATWPACPQHPNTHPLEPVAPADHACWRCPASGQEVSAIGRLDQP
jgi:hypothetical protein